MELKNSVMELLLKDHAEKKHAYNHPVACRRRGLMVVKDTDVAQDLGRMCRSRMVERPFILLITNSPTAFAFIGPIPS